MSATEQQKTTLKPTPDLLNLGLMKDKLSVLSKTTGNSKSEIVRKVLKDNWDKIPEMLRPKVAEGESKVTHKRASHFYIGADRSRKLDTYKKKTNMDKSTLVCFLLDKFIHERPQDFEEL